MPYPAVRHASPIAWGRLGWRGIFNDEQWTKLAKMDGCEMGATTEAKKYKMGSTHKAVEERRRLKWEV